MPADRTLAEDVSRELVDLYADAEGRIAADLARRLAAGMDQPRWAEEKLAALGQLRRAIQRILQNLERDVDDHVTSALADAYDLGGESGLVEIARIGQLGERGRFDALRALPGAETVQRLARSLAGRLRGTHLPVLRWAEDVYRQVIGTVEPDIALGIATRRQTAQKAWEELLDRGVTGFVDVAGRRWNLASYVEMATRTGVAQAAVEGHLDRLAGAGLDLVLVSDAPMECFRCRPWEGKILVRGGQHGAHTVQVEHATRDGHMVTVRVAGSVDQAVAAGLLHPNCRHSLSAYLPGVTKPIRNTADPEGEAAREKLRALERKVRREKIKAGAVIDPAAAGDHQAKVRDLQAEIRQHVADTEHLGVRRKPERERINLGHTAPPPRLRPRSPADVPLAARPYHLHVDGIEDLADDVEQGLRGRPRNLLGGSPGQARLGTTASGRQVVRKGSNTALPTLARRLADAEQTVSMTARALGIRAPRVYRNAPDHVWMDYVDAPSVDALVEHAAGDPIGLAALRARLHRVIDSDAGKRLGLLDLLVENNDRHTGNWLLTADDAIVPIDHAMAFGPPFIGNPVRPPYLISDDNRLFVSTTRGPFARHYVDGDVDGRHTRWVDNDLTPADIAEVRARLARLADAYAHIGRSAWLQHMFDVLAAIEPHARGRRNLIAGR